MFPHKHLLTLCRRVKDCLFQCLQRDLTSMSHNGEELQMGENAVSQGSRNINKPGCPQICIKARFPPTEKSGQGLEWLCNDPQQ